MGLEEKSYQLHEKTFSDTAIEKDLAIYKNWFDHPTTDLWRHLQMLSVLKPFLKHEPGASWLTVGDGRFGTSATYIQRHGGEALASDISTNLLEVAKKEKMIIDFAFANAEKMPFADEQFNFSYCKQAYHHFPRPIMAVYEMLRVSKQAVMFTEPHDFTPLPVTRNVLQKTKHTIKKLVGKNNPHHDTDNYESIGNYVYSISVREFEKIALGLGLPAIAYKKFDDVYLAGVEKELFSENAALYKKIKATIASRKVENFFGVSSPNTVQMIIFKTLPTNEITQSLSEQGFTIVNFSPNPYI